MSGPVCVSYGGGVNSTAMLIVLRDKGLTPDVITFADTGAEHPHTYHHIEEMASWLADNSFPEISVVTYKKKSGERISLEDDCLKTHVLPSIVYGYKKCSAKHKVTPQDKFLRTLSIVTDAWGRGDKVNKYIGIDYGELHRARMLPEKRFSYHYPLIDEKIDRDGCIALIENEGLQVPAKSACYFCPSSKPREIRQLAHEYPDLLEKALLIERLGTERGGYFKDIPTYTDLSDGSMFPWWKYSEPELDDMIETQTITKTVNKEWIPATVKGLGRSWTWRDVIAQGELFSYDEMHGEDELPCGCYDG